MLVTHKTRYTRDVINGSRWYRMIHNFVNTARSVVSRVAGLLVFVGRARLIVFGRARLIVFGRILGIERLPHSNLGKPNKGQTLKFCLTLL